MKLSDLFTKTRKQAPADEESRNAQLLIQAGYIHKQMAGVYAYLPLGLKVVENIKSVVRKEMSALGNQELIMTNLQPKELWEKTDRWDEQKVNVWFKTKLQNDTPIGLAWSHEEPITDMMKDFIASYRDLPVGVYQFQTKLRNELRAKSGIMRGREFVMKDLYSYTASQAEHDKFYDQVTKAYLKIFERLGIGDKTYVTYASGGDFTEFSHEFQTLTDMGEDTIYLDRAKGLAINQEVYSDKVVEQLGLDASQLEKVQASEVGNIFGFGTAKSDQLGLQFTDEAGQTKPVYLGSYGIGITRLVGLLAELFADERGLVWPEAVAPFKVHIVQIGDTEDVAKMAESLYKDLQDSSVETLWDDRDMRAGEKLADADLLGMPWRVVVSDKTISEGKVELSKRAGQNEPKLVTAQEVISTLTSKK